MLAFLFIYVIFKPHLSRDDSAFLFGIYESSANLVFIRFARQSTEK